MFCYFPCSENLIIHIAFMELNYIQYPPQKIHFHALFNKILPDDKKIYIKRDMRVIIMLT